ncbi:unnamed protein product [Rotaria socialis]|uniref:Glycosyltransferase 61 catalytic domain-containing protein n=1 Tax=Rotaria socialis TaxID=392032 RepID=A0A818H108_9BILA|nr:unnamed protein product [Rotaria socialis]CAF4781574.1 unnamed protein product [Rotaria socialis]
MNQFYVFILFVVFITIGYAGLTYVYSSLPFPQFYRQRQDELTKILQNYDDTRGWISSSLYAELNSYIATRKYTTRNVKKTFAIKNHTATNLPLNYDYIEFIKDDRTKIYPYSSWKCSETSNSDFETSGGYCVLTNIYYQSSTDLYYFFRDPSSQGQPDTRRDTFMVPYGVFKLNITDNIKIIERLNLAAILTRPLLINYPPDTNYAHGFLETCAPRFWTLAECQSHPSYIDPAKIQIYFTSYLLRYQPNRDNYHRQSDGTYIPVRRWEQMIQSMFSIYPLLTYQSFNGSTVMFQYALLTGDNKPRVAAWGHHYTTNRMFQSFPFPTVHYRRAYLAYSEWILNSFNLKSKFELTSVQEELQHKKLSEQIPVCDQTCSDHRKNNISSNEFTGEWIVVLNRVGIRRREMINADELVRYLLKAFPDRKNPYLRVWPKQFNFNDNLYDIARMARSIRLLIGVHGAGLSNTLFMRPGAILYEVNPYGCRHLSFNFKRWANVFNLQHALWVPFKGENGQTDDVCDREGPTTLNIKDIINEVKGLLKDEAEYRTGYLRRALKIITDTSIVDRPPSGFENIL